jgi:hypothetical protein
MTLDQMIAVAEKYARSVLINKKGVQLAPAFCIENKDNIDVLVAPWRGLRERAMALNLIQFQMREMKAIAYSVVSEAWVAEEPIEVNKRSGLMPSERSDRKEVVFIIAVNKQEKKGIFFSIIRNEKGIVIDLIEQKDKTLSNDFLDGELVSLLDD